MTLIFLSALLTIRIMRSTTEMQVFSQNYQSSGVRGTLVLGECNCDDDDADDETLQYFSGVPLPGLFCLTLKHMFYKNMRVAILQMAFLSIDGLQHYTTKILNLLTNFVPVMRKINGKSLSSDVVLDIEDIDLLKEELDFLRDTTSNPMRGIILQEDFDALSDEQKRKGTYIIAESSDFLTNVSDSIKSQTVSFSEDMDNVVNEEESDESLRIASFEISVEPSEG